MTITHCDDYYWENIDTSYNLENIFGTNLENCDDNNCYTIGAIHTINDESDYAYDMQRHKLGDVMFDENGMLRIYLLQLMFVPNLGMLCFVNMIILVPQVLTCKFPMMIACLIFMMIAIFMKVGLEECQL